MQIEKKYYIYIIAYTIIMYIWLGFAPEKVKLTGIAIFIMIEFIAVIFVFYNSKKFKNNVDNNESTREKFHEIQNTNNYLEAEAIKRTKELIKKNEELEYKNLELYRAANLDTLTELPNRRNFLHLINEVIENRELDKRFSIIFIDIDRFKSINDLYGHDMGDKIIIKVGTRLNEILKSTDYLARLAGDEFGIIIENMNSDEEVIEKGNKILSVFEEQFEMDTLKIAISASIGISIFPDNGKIRSELMRHADIALHTAKKSGEKSVTLYAKEMKLNELKRLKIESYLHSIIKNKEAYLLFQPIYSFENNSVSGFEALIRWESPELGMVSPGEFIPIAEETGHILEIGEFVLREACYAIKEINEKFNSNYKISINISPKQFLAGNLADKVTEFITQGVNPNWLDFEITEGCALIDEHLTIKNINKLKSLGVSIAIDDYGIGYSSLSYLINYPIDTLKIDRSLVEELHSNANNFKIIKGIISMCKELNLNVVSEGIETKEQRVALKSLGCSHGQGYLISRPITFDGILEYISKEAKLGTIK